MDGMWDILQEALDVADQIGELLQSVWSREWEIGEESDGVRVSETVVFRNIADMVAVVLGGRSDIETIDAVVVERGSLSGSLINDHFTPCWG